MEIMKAPSVILKTLLILFSFAFYACNKNSNNDSSAVTTQDRNFAMNASALNFTEIQFAQLAVQKGTRDSVKNFANLMITDHTKAKNELDSVTMKLNIQHTDSMNAAHRTLYSSLSQITGPRFDSTYIANQVLDHQLTLELLQNQITSGGNSSLVNYARKQVPIVTMHLQIATEIRNNMNHQGQYR